MLRIKITPKAGKRVRNPFQGGFFIPDAGIEVPFNAYWYRRKSEGVLDIVELGESDDKPKSTPEELPAEELSVPRTKKRKGKLKE